MMSGLPVLTYKAKTACGLRISGGAGGGYFTAAGTYCCVILRHHTPSFDNNV